jgi:hypothetical protein
MNDAALSVGGPNKNGIPVTAAAARDAALAKGMTINVPAIMARKPSAADIADLDLYYADGVTGGPCSNP